MRAHLEYAHTLDPISWRDRHAQGLVPDSLPYGLDRLEESGFEVSVRPRPPRVVRTGDAAVRQVTGGLSAFEALTARERRAADISVCWDTRSGAAAAVRSTLRGEPPVAFGVIWLTEDSVSYPPAGRLLARRALHSAAAVWAMSPAQLRPLHESWGAPENRLHLLHMGIDADFWTPADGAQEPDLVVASGNDRHRDHGLIVAALSELRRKRPVRLELASHHDVDVPPELGRRHPQLDHRAMRDLYGRGALVALALKPNLHISGLSVLLESMASGRAVVATETPGMREYLEDGVTGLLVPPGDPARLAGAVEELLDEPERAAELGRAGRAAVERHFSTAQQAASLAEILRTALER